jgi:hypothetical protein
MMMGALSDQGTDPATAAMRGYRYKHGDRPLDGYTVQRAAGRGAFGEVYYAISDSGREVALKVVLTYEQVELRGIGQCMNLKSPHLVSVFDVRDGEHGQPVVIMEYVAGPSLRELLDDSPSGFGAQKAAFFLREIGKGLTYLHDCGIVHRDLKPANIFYENGYVKIGDYGLSKAISASHRSAQTVTVGTLHYMAPEVGAGCYDRSVDIYALGALLFEMLTGQPPFFGVSPAEVLMKHLSVPVQVEGIEEPFATVIRRALAKDPAQRYQSVQEMVEGVFGAEHIRQSVSCFAPASLTMVAGRVAHLGARLRETPGGPAGVPLSSRAYDVAVNAPPLERGAGWAERLRWRGQLLQRRMHDVARRWADRAQRAVGRAVAPINPRQAAPRPLSAIAGSGSSVPAADSLLPGNRILLAAIAMLAVAVAAGIFADNRNPALSAWFVILGMLGATLGVRFASALVLPDLSNESWFMRHLAAGGLASAMMIAVAIPAWVPAVHRSGWDRMQSGHTLAAICLSLLLVDWTKRTSPNRVSRVSLGHLMVVGIIAVMLAAMLESAPEVVIGVLCGTCIAVQILSPWRPLVDGGVSQAPPLPGPAVDRQILRPLERDDRRPFAADAGMAVPARPSTESPTVLKLVQRSVAAGRYVVMSPIRLLLNVVTFALTLAAFLLAVALAFDLPGLLASGRIDPRIPRDMQREMGTQNWPFVLRSLGSIGLFLLACLALVFIIWVRRSRGSLHLLRGITGAVILLAAPFVMAHGGIEWGVAIEPVRNGWTAWQELVQGLSPGAAVCAAAMFITAMVLHLWPAAPRRAPSAEQPMAATDDAPTLMAGAHK